MAADNSGATCTSCAPRPGPSAFRPEAYSLEFWTSGNFAEASSERHIGKLFKAYRESVKPMLTQGELAESLGLSQGQVSRIERSVTPVQDIAKLAKWASTLCVPEELLWFKYPNSEYLPVKANASDQNSGKHNVGMRRKELLKAIGADIMAPSAIKSPAVSDRRIVGVEDVAIMREMARTFRDLDNRYGGGHSRAAVAGYIDDQVLPALKDGQYSRKSKVEFFSVAAELHHIRGWMAYDVGDLKEGRRSLRESIRISQEIHDNAYCAEMLAGMSHQAAFHGQPDVAVDLALAAKNSGAKSGIANLHAEAATLEAHGLALQADSRATIQALRRAERHFVDPEANDGPAWLSYFDEAYLCAKFAHVLRDLGRPKDAERFARQALVMNEGFERGKLFNTALLASILADQGKVDEASRFVSIAAQMAGKIRSKRTNEYLNSALRRLRPYRDTVEIRDLHESVRNIMS